MSEPYERQRKRAAIRLFGEDTVIHWTDMAGLRYVLDQGFLDPGTSFTASADLPFPIDNRKPVGLVFRRRDIERLHYKSLPIDQEGVTALELVYELTHGESVPMSLMLGLTSYRRAVLRDAKDVVEGENVMREIAGEEPYSTRTRIIGRPDYETFDLPDEFARDWTDEQKTDYRLTTGGSIVTLPRRRAVRVHHHWRRAS